jgi:hypothetical protein
MYNNNDEDEKNDYDVVYVEIERRTMKMKRS